MKKTGLITQARMGSTRLPGKIMMEVLNRPLLDFFVERCKRIPEIDEFIIATTEEEADDQIVEYCQKNSISFIRGSSEDVLDRYYQAAKKYSITDIVRITSDCPLIDPEVSSLTIQFYHSEKVWDYVTNNFSPHYPHGLDTEIFSFEALERAAKNAKDPFDREHVTGYFLKTESLVKRAQAPIHEKGDFSEHRWTLDYPEDFQFIKAVLERIYPSNPRFTWRDLLKLLEQQPELNDINRSRRVPHA